MENKPNILGEKEESTGTLCLRSSGREGWREEFGTLFMEEWGLWANGFSSTFLLTPISIAVTDNLLSDGDKDYLQYN